MGIPDPNEYDALMLSVYKMISRDDKKAYLIDAPPGSCTEKHELTHAMFFLDDEYRYQATQIIIDIDDTCTKAPPLARGHGRCCAQDGILTDLKKALFDGGYTENTVIDEINAFITTGEAGWLNVPAKKHHVEMMKLRRELKALHGKFYPKFTKGMK